MRNFLMKTALMCLISFTIKAQDLAFKPKHIKEKVQENLFDSTVSLQNFSDEDSYNIGASKISLSNNNHNSEGFLVNYSDTIINIYRKSNVLSHVDNSGVIVKRYSYDGGSTWTYPVNDTIYNSIYDDRNIAGGKLDDGRIVCFFRRYNNTSSVSVDLNVIYSDDKGITWSNPSILNVIYPADAGAFFGNIIKMGSEYWALHYSSYWAELFKSADGAIWTSAGLVYDYKIALTPKTNEAALVKIDNTKAIIIVRDEASPTLSNRPYLQFKTTNSGSTWVFQGKTNMNLEGYQGVSPMGVLDSNRNKLLSIGSFRKYINNGKYFQDDKLVFYVGEPMEVLVSPTAWKEKTIIPRPYSSAMSTYGYPAIVQLDTNKWFVTFNERSIDNSSDGVGPVGERTDVHQLDIIFDKYKSVFSDNDGMVYWNSQRKQFEIKQYDRILSYEPIQNIARISKNATLELTTPAWNDSNPVLVSRDRTNIAKYWLYGNGNSLQKGNARVNNVLPNANNTYGLGNTSLRWNNVFLNGPDKGIAYLDNAGQLKFSATSGFDYNNDYLGIGTTSPIFPLHITSNTAANIVADRYGTNGSGFISLRAYAGTPNVPAAILINRGLGTITFNGYNGITSAQGIALFSRSTENWNGTNRGAEFSIQFNKTGSAGIKTAFGIKGSGATVIASTLSTTAYDAFIPTAKLTVIGDINAGANILELNNSSNINKLSVDSSGNLTASGTVKIVVAEYSDNAAAITAGLSVGTIYRTGDLLKIVH